MLLYTSAKAQYLTIFRFGYVRNTRGGYLTSDTLTTTPFQSQQSALFNCYMKPWPRIYRRSIVGIQNDIFDG